MTGFDSKFSKAIFFILLFFAITLLCAVLKVMDSFFKPVVLSVLLSFAFYPSIKRLNVVLKLPWWLATIIVYFFSLIVVFLAINLVTASFKSIVDAIPRYQERFQNIQNAIRIAIESHPDSKFYAILNFDKDESLFENLNNTFNILEYIQRLAVGFTSSVVSFMKTFFLVVLLSVFFLAELKMMRTKISLAFNSEDKTRVYKMVQNIIADVTHFISIKFVISFFTGFLVFLLCFFMNLDFPLVWAFIAFCLNFIPTFGSIISCAVTTLFALIQFYPSAFSVIAVAFFMILINFVLGNVIEPKIEGKNLGISPFVILVSLSFFGWIWGILGMFLAVPFMVIVKIVCENISYLKPIAVFIGSKS